MSSVFCLLQIWHWTYSVMYFLKRFSICFCWMTILMAILRYSYWNPYYPLSPLDLISWWKSSLHAQGVGLTAHKVRQSLLWQFFWSQLLLIVVVLEQFWTSMLCLWIEKPNSGLFLFNNSVARFKSWIYLFSWSTTLVATTATGASYLAILLDYYLYHPF